MQMWLNGLHLDAKWHRRVRVSQRYLHSLSRWRDGAHLLMGVPMGAIPSRRETVTVDACLSGWGAVWQGGTVQGQWSAQEGARHINVLELRAVLLALMHFLPQLAGKHVLVRSDNMSAVSQINHQGAPGLHNCSGFHRASCLRRFPAWPVCGQSFCQGSRIRSQISSLGTSLHSGSPGQR